MKNSKNVVAEFPTYQMIDLLATNETEVSTFCSLQFLIIVIFCFLCEYVMIKSMPKLKPVHRQQNETPSLSSLPHRIIFR